MTRLLNKIRKLFNYIFGVSMPVLPRNKDGSLDQSSIFKASIIYDNNGKPILIRIETSSGVISIPYDLKIHNELKLILDYIEDSYLEELIDFYNNHKETIDTLERKFNPNKNIKNKP
ncbi:MAG: hypothetical protein BVN34_06335 [Proteobacteria bacterium ST_bin12]|nr:MAG: hypothetical protein BVN34_06335 [Proteobacteria bacterium ST_bin12]